MSQTLFLFAVAALSGGLVGMVWPLPVPKSTRVRLRGGLDDILAEWPAGSRWTAERLIETHGPPERAIDELLVWEGGPWKILVFRDPARPDSAMVSEELQLATSRASPSF
jgi:hypothetical protein